MKTGLKNILKYFKYILFTSIGIFLLVYVFRSQNISNIFHLIATSNIYLLLLAVFIFFIIHILRALRWQILIEPFSQKPFVLNLYNAIISSLLVNIVITRFGEIYRCIIIKKTNKIPSSILIGTVVTERIIDLLSLLIVIIIFSLTNYYTSKQYFNDHILSNLSYNNLILITAIIIFLVILSSLFILYVQKRKKRNYFLIKIKRFSKELYKGVKSIFRIKNKLLFVFYSVIIWLLYWLFTYIMMLAFPPTENLAVSASLVVIALSGVAMALPIQSGIGAFHILITNALILYSIPKHEALAYATLAHGLPLVTVMFLGSIAFLSIYLTLKKNKKYE